MVDKDAEFVYNNGTAAEETNMTKIVESELFEFDAPVDAVEWLKNNK